ncbi:MAG TPA: hypothetical protein VJP02_16600 [Candidatus Sulfotelmatobacter sp.]|nr:hypothetical protein [Candidatus Sulfotelmatobacter sp.]
MESLFGKLGRLVETLTDKGKFKEYREASKSCTLVESKIACAESCLRTISESRGPISKHNGAGDNRVTEFRESAGGQITETISKADQTLYASLGISEADQRRVNGLPPAGANLTPSQLRGYRFLRSIKLSENDSLRGALKVA